MKKTIDGIEYTFQKLSAMEVVRMKERASNEKGILVDSLLFGELAEHVIVKPRIDIEAIDDYEVLKELMETALHFQLGKGKPEAK